MKNLHVVRFLSWGLILCISLILFSCVGNQTIKMINEIFAHYDHDIDVSEKLVVVVIPAEGCDSCIDTTFLFLEENRNENMKVIATGYNKKMIKIRLNKFDLREINIVIDYKGLSLKNKLVDFTPVVYLIENNSVTNKITLTFDNISAESYNILNFLKT